MVDPGETVNMTLAREFQEEALDILESGPQNANSLHEKVNELFSENGKEVTELEIAKNGDVVHQLHELMIFCSFSEKTDPSTTLFHY